MLTIIEKVVFLQDIPAFAEVPTEQLSHIASITEESELEPDVVLIKRRGHEVAEALGEAPVAALAGPAAQVLRVVRAAHQGGPVEGEEGP